MPFIGKNPNAGFSTIVKDTLTADGSTTQFTLSKQVGNATDIAVFVGNVRQEPTTAYTVSGTTLDFGSGNAPAVGLDMYVLHIGGTQETSIIPADGTISSAKLATNIAVSGNLDIGGVSTEPNKEYFQVQLTSSQTPISDAAEATVDFNGNGAVVYDTKSQWDASNNAYEFDSNGGVYLISLSDLVCSDAVNTEVLQDTGAQVEVATDGSTYTGMFGAYFRPNDSASENQGSVHLAGTYIYKTTTATTKIRLRVKADTLSGANYEVRFDDGNMQSLNFTATGGRGTYLNVVRMA
jgi:hypothetical protein